jgi:hypothetical protein
MWAGADWTWYKRVLRNDVISTESYLKELVEHQRGLPVQVSSRSITWISAYWMGDDGFLRKAKSQIRRHNPDGDAIFIDGTVTRKFVEDGKYLVEISQQARTHRDELSAPGTAIVELPSRAGSP